MTSYSEDLQITTTDFEGLTTVAVSAIDLAQQTSAATDHPQLLQERKSTVSIVVADGTRRTDPAVALEAETAKETYLWKARLAQEAGRYEDMAGYMKLVTETGAPMTKEEDNMLAAAYKRVVDAKRTSRRALAAAEQKTDLAPWQAAVARRYRARVDAELRALCADVLAVVDSWLSSTRPATSDPATGVFYWKLRADYSRYAAEAAAADDPESRSVAVAESRAAYEQAETMGRHALLAVDPVRLGLMLNYSVFLYQVCQQRRQGHDLAKRAFDDAVNEIDAIDAQMYDDATLILRLIRDNLAIWVQENGGASFSEATAANRPTAAETAPPPAQNDDASQSWSLDDQPPPTPRESP